jgi:hypothetical protein
MRHLSLLLCLIFVGSLRATDYRPNSGELEDLTGTKWEMIDSANEKTIWTLEPHGVLSYQSPTGFWRNGSWKQDGPHLYIETNNRYYEATGTVNGDIIENGKFWNVAGLKGTWSGRRK